MPKRTRRTGKPFSGNFTQPASPRRDRGRAGELLALARGQLARRGPQAASYAAVCVGPQHARARGENWTNV
jgi:hypothetical protein